MSKEYTDFLNRWAANSERLHRVGIHPFGYDPGFLCTIDGDSRKRGVEIPEDVAEIICLLVKKVYPETQDDEKMIAAYQKRLDNNRRNNS